MSSQHKSSSSSSSKSKKSSDSHSTHSHHAHHSSSTSSHSTSRTEKQYYLLLTSTPLRAATTESEIDLHAESWKLPYSIDDSDLTFDGKPLNMLYEENRWEAEHSGERGEWDYYSSSGSSSSGSSYLDYGEGMLEFTSRGRSRQSKK